MSQDIAFGTSLIAFIGYGCAISFCLMSLAGLVGAFVGDRTKFNRRMNSFVTAGIIAFLATFCTVVALKILG